MIKINRILTGCILLLMGFWIFRIFTSVDLSNILNLTTNIFTLITLRMQAGILKRLK
jgi:hypothetical protein